MKSGVQDDCLYFIFFLHKFKQGSNTELTEIKVNCLENGQIENKSDKQLDVSVDLMFILNHFHILTLFVEYNNLNMDIHIGFLTYMCRYNTNISKCFNNLFLFILGDYFTRYSFEVSITKSIFEFFICRQQKAV